RDDRPLAPAEHAAQGRAGRVEGPAQVRVEHRAPVLPAHAKRRAVTRDAGVQHDGGEVAEAVLDGADQRRGLPLVGDVAPVHERGTAGRTHRLGGGLGARLVVQVADADVEAGRRACPGAGRGQPPRPRRGTSPPAAGPRARAGAPPPPAPPPRPGAAPRPPPRASPESTRPGPTSTKRVAPIATAASTAAPNRTGEASWPSST